MSNGLGKTYLPYFQRLLSLRSNAAAWLAAAFVLVSFPIVGNEVFSRPFPPAAPGELWYSLQNFFGGHDACDADARRLAFAASQVSLLMLWACFGRRRWVLRWLTATVGVAFCIMTLVAVSVWNYRPTQVEVLLLSQSIAVAALAWGLRLCGWRLELEGHETAPAPRLQFGMQDLFLLAGGVGILAMIAPNLFPLWSLRELLAACQYARVALSKDDPRPLLAWMMLSGAACALIGVLGLRLLLRPGDAWLRLAAFGLAAWAIGRVMILSYLNFCIYCCGRISLYTKAGPIFGYQAWFCLQAALLAFCLLVLRRAGYRLENRKSSDRRAREQVQGAANFRPGLRAFAAVLLLLLGAASFDYLVPWINGDLALRQQIAIIQSEFDGRARLFCFRPSPLWAAGRSPFLEVHLSGPLDERMIARLGDLSLVEGLWILRKCVADEWRALLQLRQLKRLWCTGPAEQQLGQLAMLWELRDLTIFEGNVTDAALMQLAALPKLKRLNLPVGSEVTAQGIARFKRAKPAVVVSR